MFRPGQRVKVNFTDFSITAFTLLHQGKTYELAARVRLSDWAWCTTCGVVFWERALQPIVPDTPFNRAVQEYIDRELGHG